MVHGNSERFSKALVSNLKPDLVLAVPNDLFCVTNALQLLIVHFIAIKSLHVLITATFFCIFFQLPLDFILDYIFFFFSPSPDHLSHLSDRWWTVLADPKRDVRSVVLMTPIQCENNFIFYHSIILMQLELHLVLISHPYRNEIAPWFILLLKKLQTSVALSYMLKPVGCCWFTINCITLLILWNLLKLHSGTRNKAQGL